MTKTERNIFCILVVLLMALTFTAISVRTQVAYAAEANAFDSASCIDFDGDTQDYDMNQKPYARNVTLTFSVPYDHFIIQLFRFGESTMYLQTPITATTDGKAVYTIPVSGYFSVLCYGCDAGGTLLEESVASVTVKSDVSGPNEATVSQMTDWVSVVGDTSENPQKGFLVNVRIENDDYSGIKEALITTIYPDRENRLPLNSETGFVSSFRILENCRVCVDIFDNAGNCTTKFYEYDKFDNDAPTSPQIVVTPTPTAGVDTNGFTRSCEVTLNYGTDVLSGTNNGSMKYTLNGELKNYDGSFVCDKSIKYTIIAYYFDNAGNQSPVATSEITNVDDVEPTVHSLRLKVDLTEEIPYTLTVSCSDTLSGIKSVLLDGKIPATKKQYNDYEATFSTLDKGSISVTVTDLVGNYTTTHISTHHFDTIALEEKAVAYHQKFLSLDGTLYNANAWERLLSAYTALNILYMAENSTDLDFNNAFATIDSAIMGKVTSSYSVESAPDVVSANVSFTFEESDLKDKKLGDTVHLGLAAINADSMSDLTSKAMTFSAFGQSFAQPFVLNLYHNGTLISDTLEKGFVVNMAVPAGYEARHFAVVDLDGNTVVESETINNAISFSAKKSGNYALIIEGNKITTETKETVKGVSVFGKTISIGALVGSICGAVGVIVIGIILIVVLGKK